MSSLKLDEALISALRESGVETLHAPHVATLPEDSLLEAPCSIKWMEIHQPFRMGAFSYAVSGYYNNVSIGRYVSIGESVQVGRGNHSLAWVSTSPFFYLYESMFNLGNKFHDAPDYHNYLPNMTNREFFTEGGRTVIENDVWIGHAAHIRPGIHIGTGAVIGAEAVVTRNVPAYAVVVGNPARIVKYRFEQAIIDQLLASEWWTYAPWQLQDVDFSRPILALSELARLKKSTPPYYGSIVSLAQLKAEISALE